MSPEVFIGWFNFPTAKRYWAFYDPVTQSPAQSDRKKKRGVSLGKGGLWESTPRFAQGSRRVSQVGVSHFPSLMEVTLRKTWSQREGPELCYV